MAAAAGGASASAAAGAAAGAGAPAPVVEDGGALRTDSLFDVRGRVVLVTGGARGIGLLIASAFVANGAHVVLAGRAAETGAAAVSALVERLGATDRTGATDAPAVDAKKGSVRFVQANLAKEEAVVALAAEVERTEKRLDVLVNNAGANWGEDLKTFPSAAWDKVMDLNVRSIFLLTRACAPLLEASADARRAAQPEADRAARGAMSTVINIGSINGEAVPMLETYSYSTSKAAVHHLSRVLSAKLASQHITVNALACGVFPTKMMAATLDAHRDAILSGVPVGRVGTAFDIGAACIWLASSGGSWVTGAVIPIDGGALAAPKL